LDVIETTRGPHTVCVLGVNECSYSKRASLHGISLLKFFLGEIKDKKLENEEIFGRFQSPKSEGNNSFHLFIFPDF
jgi:hypothetical protein